MPISLWECGHSNHRTLVVSNSDYTHKKADATRLLDASTASANGDKNGCAFLYQKHNRESLQNLKASLLLDIWARVGLVFADFLGTNKRTEVSFPPRCHKAESSLPPVREPELNRLQFLGGFKASPFLFASFEMLHESECVKENLLALNLESTES